MCVEVRARESQGKTISWSGKTRQLNKNSDALDVVKKAAVLIQSYRKISEEL